MTHLFQCDPNGDGIFHVEKESSQFCFSCRGHYMLDDVGVDKDGAIHRREGIGGSWLAMRVDGFRAKVEVSTKLTS